MNIRNSRSQGQAQRSSSYSPAKASKQQNPKNPRYTWLHVRRYRSAWRSTPVQQAVSCWSSIYCGFPSSSQTWGVPPSQAPCSQPSITPPSAIPPNPPTERQSSCYIGNAKMMQSTPSSFSFPQAFIYSLPWILRLQIFLLREGFLVKVAPAHMEGSSSTCFCIILNCMFKSQLKKNLMQGFFCLHKGRLQKHGRKGRVKINSQELIQVLTVSLILKTWQLWVLYHYSNPRPLYH